MNTGTLSAADSTADQLRFDGRVAIVTGAGRSLGRAEALLLAERGAKVVVNDLGASVDGLGADASPAEEVVREIVALGGEAILSAADVADQQAMRELVLSTIDAFGRLDIVVNNAGILVGTDIQTLSGDVLQRHLDVHLLGSFNLTQAAWPHLVEQEYGRVLVTVSGAVLGAAGALAYSSAKSSLIGFMRSLAQAGAPHGVNVNAFSPSAHTRMVGDPEIRRRSGISQAAPSTKEGRGEPAEVVPMAIFLVHEASRVTGEIFTSTGTNVARLFIGATRGLTADSLTLETIRDNWSAICDEHEYFVPRSAAENAGMRNLLSL